ncbi:hypothetical protein [Myxococcus sp. RHSTA-1-4]|uniref:hypothetical protein n=1 Tax=Myxococcus sp. RHSTA-1-4 TaxID=2874601 RepID=UPI001CBB0761|nr:hypothetical protein [Myxococcus sp. RHSTA-1-4]MBZ4421271.1 hypothetical protein [Myxococcus sp. RHSTA-1-4]
MRFTSRKMASGVLLAVLTGLTACGDEAYTEDPAAEMAASPETLRAEKEAIQREASQTLTRALALSLRDPSSRGLVRAAMAQSLVKEDKVHFNSYVRGPGRALLQAMSRQSGLSVDQLEGLLGQAGSLELYLPVQEHRAAWLGDEKLLVATQLIDHEQPVGFDLNGDSVPLSADAPPAVPTLALVPSEDFDAEGTPSKRGLALGRGGQLLQAMGGVTATATTAWTGAYVNSVSIPGTSDYEAWIRGAPEFEMYLERVGSTRQKLRCAAAGSIAPFSWNMDGTSWTTPFLIAWVSETPSLEGLGMYFYEDDETECVVKDDKDYLKLTMDLLKNSLSVYMAYQQKQWDQAVISFIHATVALWSIVAGNDEYVGTVTSYNGMQIDSTERVFTIKNEAQQDKGTVKIQWRTLYY